MPQPWRSWRPRTSVCTSVARRRFWAEKGRSVSYPVTLPALSERAAGVEVDADEDVRLGHVGAHVPGGHVVVLALDGEEPAGDVAGSGAEHRLVLGPRHHHGEAPWPAAAPWCRARPGGSRRPRRWSGRTRSRRRRPDRGRRARHRGRRSDGDRPTVGAYSMQAPGLEEPGVDGAALVQPPHRGRRAETVRAGTAPTPRRRRQDHAWRPRGRAPTATGWRAARPQRAVQPAPPSRSRRSRGASHTDRHPTDRG